MVGESTKRIVPIQQFRSRESLTIDQWDEKQEVNTEPSPLNMMPVPFATVIQKSP